LSYRIIQGNVFDKLKEISVESVHCVVTSPPYWGLRDYQIPSTIWGGNLQCEHEWDIEQFPGNYKIVAIGNLDREHQKKVASSQWCKKCGAWLGCLGLEPTPELYVAHLAEIFHKVQQVLRNDGICFINIGDSYSNGGKRQSFRNTTNQNWSGASDDKKWHGNIVREDNLKPKNLVLIPERLAIALQEDGWCVRSRIAWIKGNAMPESVTDRPTCAWEHIWMITKNKKYFCDMEAVRQKWADNRHGNPGHYKSTYAKDVTGLGGHGGLGHWDANHLIGANLRNWWKINSEPFSEAHFAVMPSEIPRRCILMSTSARGCCPQCGKPWVRVMERTSMEVRSGPKGRATRTMCSGIVTKPPTSVTTGWCSGCNHGLEPVPCTVLDPFLGSGTTCLVAEQLGRNSIGIELNPEYIKIAEKRLKKEPSLW